MLPLGHLAFAYLCYVGVAVVRRYPLPASWALPVLALGSQFPDIVDKPLAYYGVVAYGRALAHSIFTLVLVCGFLWWFARRHRGHWAPGDWREQLRTLGPLAFTVGYVSHLVGDTYRVVLAGQYTDARFVLWPIYRMPDSPADDIPPWIRLLQIYRDMETHPNLELIVLAVAVFISLRLYGLVRRHRRNREA